MEYSLKLYKIKNIEGFKLNLNVIIIMTFVQENICQNKTTNHNTNWKNINQ